MSWVASVVPGGVGRFYPPFDRMPAKGTMRRGTVLIEAHLKAIHSAQPVLRIPLQAHAAGHLSLLAMPGGSFSVVLSQGQALTHKTLRLPQSDGAPTVRLSLAWDCEKSMARLAVEEVGTRNFAVADMAVPLPMALSSLTAFEAMEICATPDADLSFVAVSNNVEPVGPLPGLGARTRVQTPFGVRDLAQLRCGDQVLVQDDGPPEPVLHVVQRVVPALGSFAPVRLRAPYFGLQQDLIVAPHQKLYVSGSGVEYTFGCEGVLVPAGHLTNGISAVREDHVSLVTYAQVLLPSHCLIRANGATVESLFIGRLRRDPAKVAASILNDVNPTLLPEQAPVKLPVLEHYEAQALIEVA